MQQRSESKPVYQSYLQGGGETGALIRNFDWSATSIGHFTTWPTSLLTTVSTLINSRFPMFLWWGPDLLQFYNDAYRPSLGKEGKHPLAIGNTGRECWPEIWPTIKPLIDQVLTGGPATWNEDQLLPIYRNNALEDAYWTYSFSRVNDDRGLPAGVLVICTETTGKIQAFRKIAEGRNELEFVVDAAELGTWDWDIPEGAISGNKRIREWFGLSDEGPFMLPDALRSAVLAEDLDRVSTDIRSALEKGSTGDYKCTYTIVNPKDQRKRIIKAKGKTVFNSEGEAIRFSGIVQDVTDDYLLQQRKDEFLSAASHELKTPLTSLKGSVQVLERMILADISSSKVPLLIKKANSNVEKLSAVIDDLLNVTKIQEGQLSLNKSWFNMSDLVSTSSDHLRLADKYQVDIQGDLDISVFGDSARIGQVLFSFINNAVKYAAESLRIEACIEAVENGVLVSVTDFGKGISPDKLPHLFDRYYRVDSAGVQFSGLGLGLYISADIVHRHGGQIGVESIPGKGSKFWFTIPVYREL